AGVDEDEAVLGGERGDVGEGGAEAEAVGDLDEPTHVVDRVGGRRRQLAVPQAIGDAEDVRCHARTDGGGRRGQSSRATGARGPSPSGSRGLPLGRGGRRVGGGRRGAVPLSPVAGPL